MTPDELANQIRTYGWWQGPEEPLNELVRRLTLAERALERIREITERALRGEEV